MILAGLLADSSASQPTMPRQPEPPSEQAQTQRGAMPADPLFDKPRAATDDAAFVRATIESVRQGVADARAAEAGLTTSGLRAAAAKIGRQQQATLEKLETVAKSKGWALPAGNPERAGSVRVSGPTRTGADFIIHQIATHRATLEQFRAQLSGDGDADLRRVLRDAIPGYEKNLDLLLGLEL